MGGYKFTKVLMDGGSSINILYYETFRRMGLTNKNLKLSNTVFHGVVPGKPAYPVGKIALEVAFGDDHDSRSETLTFEVVKTQIPFHALFGRPACAKFMARPCYVYLHHKMPGHKGTLLNQQLCCYLFPEDCQQLFLKCYQCFLKFYEPYIV